MQAEVLMVPDEPGRHAEEDKARAIQAAPGNSVAGGSGAGFSAADQSALSFYLAGSLPLDLDFKQKLLAMRSESERIQAVALSGKHSSRICGARREAREKAGGNGHAR